jgi:spore germination protein KC
MIRNLTKKWGFAAAIISVISALLAGCWDYRELENRAIVVGLGIDELPPARYKGEEMRMYQVVVQIVESAAESTGGQMGGGGGTQGQQQRGYTNFEIETPSITEGIERIVTRVDRMPNLAHLQAIVLSEKVARKGINELYDFFTRFPQMRRHTEIIVGKGSILEIFSTPSISEPTPTLHIAELANNVQQTLLVPESNLGTVSKSVRTKTPFLLLKASLDQKKQIVINEAAVFDNFNMVGSLSRDQMLDISILQDEIQRGVLHFPCYGGKKAGLQILAGDCKIRPEFRQGRPHVTFEVELDSEMMEYQCLGASFDKPEQIERLEQRVSDMLKNRLLKTAEELKNRYKADVFRLTTRLKNEPEMYEEIRKQPSEFFRKLVFDVTVDLKIRNIGNTLETPSREWRP